MSGGYIKSSGGGGGLTKYDATVGSTGANYTDIQAAITGVGGTDIKLLLITDVTENSDITIPASADLLLDLSSYKLTMGAYHFLYTSDADVMVIGNGDDSGAKIDWSPTSGSQKLFNAVATGASTLTMNNLRLDFNSTYDYITLSGAQERLSNIYFELPNSIGGINAGVDHCKYSNITLAGGGSDSERAFESGGGGTVFSNIIIKGTFKTAGRLFTTNTYSPLSNVIIDTPTDTYCQVYDNLANISAIGIGSLDIYIRENGVNLTNIKSNGGKLDTYAYDNVNIVNSYFDTMDLTDASATNNKFTNVRVANSVTIGGDRHKFTNCDLLGGVSVSSGADDNGFSNCQFGADAGGGSNTLTIVSGSNRTRVVGCMSDASISDSGTNTELSANTVY